MTAAEIKEHLQELLADVARSRKEDDPDNFAVTLEGALELYPAFPETAALLDGWIAELEQLVPEQPEDLAADFGIRKALIAMRRKEGEAGLAILDGLAIPDWAAPQRYRAALTRGRLLARLRRLDEADAALKQAEALLAQVPSPVPSFPGLLTCARSELALERGDESCWELTHQGLAQVPTELYEDRLQLHQQLAFLYVAKVDGMGALRQFQAAKEIVEGCGATSELLQMLLAAGSLRLATGDVAGSNRDFDEALKLAAENPSAELLPLVKMGASRARAAAGDLQAATQEALQAAMAFAQRGSVLGYMGIIAYLHSLHLEAKEFREAYRILATGLSVAKRLKQPAAEHLFRALVNRQRDQIMGAASFDKMVEKMIRAADPKT